MGTTNDRAKVIRCSLGDIDMHAQQTVGQSLLRGICFVFTTGKQANVCRVSALDVMLQVMVEHVGLSSIRTSQTLRERTIPVVFLGGIGMQCRILYCGSLVPIKSNSFL